MKTGSTQHEGSLAAFHLLGTIEFDACLALQTRLVYEAGEREDDRIVVLLCEHPPLVTIGRSGSRGHVRLPQRVLDRRQIDARWVGRGGGCVLHQEGQLAVYPVVPLARRGWLVGEYVQRLKQGLVGTLEVLGIRGQQHDGVFGIHGRSGVLASVGVAVRGGVALHGAWINVQPALSVGQQMDVIPPHLALPGLKTTAGSLLAERGPAVTMQKVRAALIERMAAALDCPRQHVHGGHPHVLPRQRVSA